MIFAIRQTQRALHRVERNRHRLATLAQSLARLRPVQLFEIVDELDDRFAGVVALGPTDPFRQGIEAGFEIGGKAKGEHRRRPSAMQVSHHARAAIIARASASAVSMPSTAADMMPPA